MHYSFKRTVFSLGSVLAIRMLGLFMILPIFVTQATLLTGSTTTLIGLALGIYGLTQACLQIPFAMLSDHIGRKPVIFLGLCLFVIGSVIAALSHNIIPLIIGRAIQGGGAVGSTILALTADLTRSEDRTKAMASMGMLIGFSFMLAVIFGPIVNHFYHLSGIFWLTAILGVIGIVVLYALVPTPPKPCQPSDQKRLSQQLLFALMHPELLRLDIGIFIQHMVLTLLFLSLPLFFSHLNFSSLHQSLAYFSILILSFIAMLPLVIIAEKKRLMKPVFLIFIMLLIISLLSINLWHATHWVLYAMLWLFFAGFTGLESCLPSLVSKIAPIANKGTAMGIYSSAQFLGIFAGGSIGGLLLSHFHTSGVLYFACISTAIWWALAYTMKTPPTLSTLIISLPPHYDVNKALVALRRLPGVLESEANTVEALIYIKTDKATTNKADCEAVIKSASQHKNA